MRSNQFLFIKRIIKLFSFMVLVWVCLSCTPKKQSKEDNQSVSDSGAAFKKTPNFIFIFIDDMGYGDIGPFGSKKNKTPNLDRMADEGLKLTDFYVSNTACTPSRTALLTGIYASRIGMDGPVCLAGDARGLSPEENTIADILKNKGYATGCFGKWHLGDQSKFLPLNQGFDEFVGIPYSNDIWPLHRFNEKYNFPPLPFMKDNQAVAHIPDGASQSVLGGAITDAAIDFIKRKRDEPFFVYIPYARVHQPRFAPQKWVDQADEDYTRAQIEELDDHVGKILQTLKELGLDERTLVMFTSDNGGSGGTSMGPLRGWKGGPKYEGRMRMPTLAWWPGTIPAGSVTSEIGATVDILPTFVKFAGAEIPTAIDGKDISSLLLAKKGARSPHDVLFYEIEGVRKGKWKMVHNHQRYELYNLDIDLGERNDLAGEHPERLKELKILLDQHTKHIKANTRPAGFVKNPKPILTSVEGLPSLVDYLELTAVEWSGSYEPIISEGHH